VTARVFEGCVRVHIAVLSRRWDERGASAVEYALLVAAIAAIIVAVVFGVGILVKTQFSDTSSCISDKGVGC
jgi:pilus assembly protein Flp/PilA